MTAPAHPAPIQTQQVRRPARPRPSWANVVRLSDAAAWQDTEVVPHDAVQGTLALDLGPSTRRPPQTPELYAVPGGRDDRAEELRAWAARFAQAVVEVTGGDRPLTQLLRWTTSRVYADLSRRVRLMAASRPVGQRRRTVRPQVRSVHIFQPTPTSAEVSVHVRYGQRSRALAARLEQRSGHWTCTELLLG